MSPVLYLKLARLTTASTAGSGLLGKIRGFAMWAQYLESALGPHAEDQPITRDRRFGAGLAVLFGGGSFAPSVAQHTITPQPGLR